MIPPTVAPVFVRCCPLCELDGVNAVGERAGVEESPRGEEEGGTTVVVSPNVPVESGPVAVGEEELCPGFELVAEADESTTK